MKKDRKWITGLLFLIVLLVSGCRDTAGQAKEADVTGERQNAESSASMGRYMETACPVPEEINRNGGLNWLDDGTLSIISYGSGLFRSSDEGRSWQQEETEWFPMIQNVYCLSAVMGPDGTVAASCSGEMSEIVRQAYGEPVEEDWEGNYCVFALPDGVVKIVDFGFTQEEGTCISSFCFKEDGRLFAGDLSGRVYEVNIENASLKELFVADRAVGSMDFSGETLLAVGYDRLYLYDLTKQVPLAQDGTADAFIRQELADGTVSYTSGGYPLAVAGAEDDLIYIACKDGLYRHVLGGSTVEQIIDGALSTFGDSASHIYSVKVLEDQEFFVLFNPSSGAVRYAYDETVPSMPDKEIRIYSLEENQSVRQAVTAYKKEHTDMYVRYEVGIEENGGITPEDALKKLNTRILAGEGPDVLILDGLPIDTYVEKGMLKDLSGVIGSLTGEDTLFPNLVEGFTEEDGAIYAMPMCIQVPILVGDKEVIGRINNLESFASEMEKLRQEHPKGGLLGIYDEDPLLRLFGMVSSSSWLDENGQMDAEAVTHFLEWTKRIYDAEMAGAVKEEVDALETETSEMEQYGVDVSALRMEVCSNVLNIPRGYARLACGYADGIQLCLDSVTSTIRVDDALSYRIFNGQGQNVFIPKDLAGISAGTGQPEEAEEFVKKMFSEETQEYMYEGYPVNRTVFEAAFDWLEEDSQNGTMTLSRVDGTEEELDLYWPNEAERQAFTEQIESLDTPVQTSGYLCELVYETGIRVLEGELSAGDGAEEIVKKAAIYLAE